MLVDSHCHLDFPDFADELHAVVARARHPAIRPIVTISTRANPPHQAQEDLHPPVSGSVARTRHPRGVAIGGAGLDYHYQYSPVAAQEQGFRRHIAAARETGLPLVIHSRDADADMARILEEETGK